eukprot:scaffold45428_cov176-Amphora_coffeaeformis.AAC.7
MQSRGCGSTAGNQALPYGHVVLVPRTMRQTEIVVVGKTGFVSRAQNLKWHSTCSWHNLSYIMMHTLGEYI